ncbi:MAG: hypothetical protein ACR2GY_05890 [Phycisphaerales bacterium]
MDQPPYQQPPPQPPHSHPPMQAGFACPLCSSSAAPVQRQRISTGGWITFAVLLLVCLPLFWIGLLIKEDYTVCGACGFRYS